MRPEIEGLSVIPMSGSVTLTVSLISHNSRKDLERLLPSLTTAVKPIPHELLLVDNCSKDHTASFLRDNYPDIKITRNRNKKGYGANHNINLKSARGNYFCLMNADMVVSPDIFEALIAFMETHHDVGIVTPGVTNEDGSTQYLNKRYPSVADLFVRRFVPEEMKMIFKKRLDRYEMRDLGYDHIMDVPFLSGAFMFTRTRLLREINGFDERFFLYFEDVDLCRRMQQNYRTVYYPHAKVVHRWERAAHKDVRWASIFMISAAKYFNKWGVKLF